MEDRRSTPGTIAIAATQLALGAARLEAEIRLIEDWLAGLEETRKDNPESLAARKTYGDMLQSRRDLLHSLQQHPKS